MSTKEIGVALTYQTVCCAGCGFPMALPSDYVAAKRRDHSNFYCPNGHTNAWKQQTDQEKEIDRLKQSVSRFSAALERKKEEHQAEKRSHAATKGLLTRTKKRVAGGRCPCCQATFSNLAGHMQRQHPDYVSPEEDAEHEGHRGDQEADAGGAAGGREADQPPPAEERDGGEAAAGEDG